MITRRFGRLGWNVSEIGYGMWGASGWTGSEDDTSRAALQRSVDLGCNFFDTAYDYGKGHSERLLGELVRANRGKKLYVSSKIPPKNRQWPSRRGVPLDNVFPADHIRSFIEASLKNLDLPFIDLMHFHVWEDDWALDERWRRTLDDARREGLINGTAISVNRWEPTNVLTTLRTGLIDAVQVIYNIFDQNPEDELFPVCQQRDVAIIARVPFDEGTLTGSLTKSSHWPEGDWRNLYFGKENLPPSVDRAEALRPLIPPGMTMAEVALRFILGNPAVSTVIPGMRRLSNVEANIATSDGRALPTDLRQALRGHRWDRLPTSWSS